MKPTKSEGWAFGCINIGISILFGLWLGFTAFLASFMVVYLTIGLLQSINYDNISIWNWFFNTVELPKLPFKESND